LRPAGRLVFLVNAPLLMICMAEAEEEPAGDRLLRPYFGMHRMEWPEDDSVDFHLPHTRSSRSTGRARGRARSCGRRGSGAERIARRLRV
jgi:hypothetical protein